MIKRRENESGYSLVEVLASIVILTIAIIPMVTMFDTGLRSATTSGNYDKARALANANLERIKAGAFPEDGTESCDAGNLDCTVEKTYVYLDTDENPAVFKDSGENPSEDRKKMMKVTVTVRWGDGSDYNVTGLVSK